MVVFLSVVSWVCLVAGGFFCIVGAIGLLRFPDFYTRAHAASVTDTLGAGLILIGLMFQVELGIVTVKLVFILVFMLLINPGAAHGMMKAAYAQGVKIRTDDTEEHAVPD